MSQQAVDPPSFERSPRRRHTKQEPACSQQVYGRGIVTRQAASSMCRERRGQLQGAKWSSLRKRNFNHCSCFRRVLTTQDLSPSSPHLKYQDRCVEAAFRFKILERNDKALRLHFVKLSGFSRLLLPRCTVLLLLHCARQTMLQRPNSKTQANVAFPSVKLSSRLTLIACSVARVELGRSSSPTISSLSRAAVKNACEGLATSLVPKL